MDENMRQQIDGIVEKVKELVSDGNATRVLLKRNGETLLNLSLNTGIIGAVIGLTAAPFAVLTTALISFGMDCEIEIEKQDGSVVNLNETDLGMKLEAIKETAKDRAKEFIDRAVNTHGADEGYPPEEPFIVEDIFTMGDAPAGDNTPGTDE